MDIIRSIHDKMVNDHLLFVFRGDVTERNSLPLITLLENEMKDDAYGFAGQKKLFMFVIESLQNISKHADHGKYSGMSLVTYARKDGGYQITTGNVISSGHVESLKKRLDEVNRLDEKGTRALYRQILSSSELSSKGGAGLGLIEMAVKTGNKLDYGFAEIDKDHSYFLLSKTVDSKGIGVHSESAGSSFNPASFVSLERLMEDNRIFHIWSGHITTGIGADVLSLTETRLNDAEVDSRLRRRIFNVMVESLENVVKYNPGREYEGKYGMPVSTIRMEDEKFSLTTGNLIWNKGIEELKNKLDTINQNNRDGLKNMFYASLSHQTIETDSTGDMGLISMALKSGNKLSYSFEPVNDEFSYFMLTVKFDDLAGQSELFQE